MNNHIDGRGDARVANSPLSTAARDAVSFLPIDWRPGDGYLRGTFKGCHDTYDVTIATPNDNVFLVRAAAWSEVPDDSTDTVGMLCADTSWYIPNAGFFVAAGAGNAVTSAATLAFDQFDASLDPLILRSAVRECLLNAELLAPVVQAVVKDGLTIPQARLFRTRMYQGYGMGELTGLSPLLAPPGLAPATDVQVIDACETAARSLGWDVFRRSPDQIVVNGGTFVDVNRGALIVSTYEIDPVRPERRLAVSRLLNELLGEGAPFGLVLDLDGGAVCARTSLELGGLRALPPASVLTDVIFQSGGGASYFAPRIDATAKARSQTPFGGSGGSLRDRILGRRAS
jgi:hypothetical protein